MRGLLISTECEISNGVFNYFGVGSVLELPTQCLSLDTVYLLIDKNLSLSISCAIAIVDALWKRDSAICLV